MAELFEFRVLRRLEGDKTYEVGDRRVMTRADAAHLVPLALREIGPAKAEAAPAEKAEEPIQNKAEPAVSNKAAPATKKKAPSQ